MSEDKDTIVINQPVDGQSYRKIKAYAAINKHTVQEEIDIAVIEYADKIKL